MSPNLLEFSSQICQHIFPLRTVWKLKPLELFFKTHKFKKASVSHLWIFHRCIYTQISKFAWKLVFELFPLFMASVCRKMHAGKSPRYNDEISSHIPLIYIIDPRSRQSISDSREYYRRHNKYNSRPKENERTLYYMVF